MPCFCSFFLPTISLTALGFGAASVLGIALQALALGFGETVVGGGVGEGVSKGVGERVGRGLLMREWMEEWSMVGKWALFTPTPWLQSQFLLSPETQGHS